MSFKLCLCLFVLILAVLACEGDSRGYFSNPKYRVLNYRNHGYGDLSNSNPVAVPIQTAGLSDDIYSYIPGSGKIKNDPNELRPVLYSIERQLRQLMRSHNKSEVTNKNILSVLKDTLTWAKAQGSSFYSLIQTFKNR